MATHGDQALGADQLDSKRPVHAGAGAHGRDGADDPVVEHVGGKELIAGHQADVLVALVDVGQAHGTPGLHHAGAHLAWVASHLPHQVHQVDAQHPQVLGAAATVVILAGGMHGHQPPDLALAQHLAQEDDGGIDPPGVGDLDLGAAAAGRGDYGVGLGRRADQRLFAVDALGPGLDGGVNHGAVQVRLAVADVDEVRLHAGQRLSIVTKGLRRSQLVRLGPSRRLVQVGHGYDFHFRNQLPGEVQVVSVVACARGSDDDGSVHQVCSVVSGQWLVVGGQHSAGGWMRIWDSVSACGKSGKSGVRGFLP